MSPAPRARAYSCRSSSPSGEPCTQLLGHYPAPHRSAWGKEWTGGVGEPSVWRKVPRVPTQATTSQPEMGEEIIWDAPAPRKTARIMSPRKRIIADLAEVYPDVDPEVVFAIFDKHAPRGHLPRAQNGTS